MLRDKIYKISPAAVSYNGVSAIEVEPKDKLISYNIALDLPSIFKPGTDFPIVGNLYLWVSYKNYEATNDPDLRMNGSVYVYFGDHKAVDDEKQKKSFTKRLNVRQHDALFEEWFDAEGWIWGGPTNDAWRDFVRWINERAPVSYNPNPYEHEDLWNLHFTHLYRE